MVNTKESESAAFEVRLLVTTQVRGAVFPVNKYGSQCSLEELLEDDGCNCFGGVRFLVTWKSLFLSSTPRFPTPSSPRLLTALF